MRAPVFYPTNLRDVIRHCYFSFIEGVIKTSDLRKKNHYVSQSYLKAWSNEDNKISSYRTLVSHEEVPLWKKKSIKNIAYQRHFYTLITEEDNSDEIERWMEREIETPAQKALDKVRSGKTLKNDDLNCLIRFMALQDVRNPVRYMEHIKRCKKQMPGILKEVLEKVKRELEKSKKLEGLTNVEEKSGANMIPLNLEKEIDEDLEQGYLKTEVLFGRRTWLSSILHVLNKTYKVLQKHDWTIIKVPDEMEWLTSDNPVVRLNYYGKEKYDFKGGWGKEGTDLFFPLSPKHLMYTEVGKEISFNQISMKFAKRLQRFIAENAHRFIFSTQSINDIEKIQPRIVDSEAFKREKKAWKNWHKSQNKAESDILKKSKNNSFGQE